MAEHVQHWNVPAGGLRVRCPDCEANGVRYEPRGFRTSDGTAKSVMAVVTCRSCEGQGGWDSVFSVE